MPWRASRRPPWVQGLAGPPSNVLGTQVYVGRPKAQTTTHTAQGGAKVPRRELSGTLLRFALCLGPEATVAELVPFLADLAGEPQEKQVLTALAMQLGKLLESALSRGVSRRGKILVCDRRGFPGRHLRHRGQ